VVVCSEFVGDVLAVVVIVGVGHTILDHHQPQRAMMVDSPEVVAYNGGGCLHGSGNKASKIKNFDTIVGLSAYH